MKNILKFPKKKDVKESKNLRVGTYSENCFYYEKIHFLTTEAE